MLLNKMMIKEEMIRMLSKWKYSGFQVFCDNRILHNDETVMKNLARYINPIGSSFSRPEYR
jgi:hypothetical protein